MRFTSAGTTVESRLVFDAPGEGIAARPASAGAPRLGRERLIVEHLPLVRSVARAFVSDAVDLEDLVQVGTIGLIKAVDRYDPDRGVSLAAYARPTVAGEILRHLRDCAPVVRVPRRLHELQGRLRRTERELTPRLGRAASDAELARAAGASEADARAVLDLDGARRPLSLDAVEEPEAPDPFDASDDRLLLSECSRALDERGRRIVHLRFFAGFSVREIASELGISQAHVSRLLSEALTELRRELECRGIDVWDIVLPVHESYTRAHGAARAAR